MKEYESSINYFKSILEEKKECPDGCISIREVIRRYEKKQNEFQGKEKFLIYTLENHWKRCNSLPGLFTNTIDIKIEQFNYDKNSIKIEIKRDGDDEKSFMEVAKINNDLIMIDSNYYKEEEFFFTYDVILSKLCDLYKNNKSYMQDAIGDLFRGENIPGTSLSFSLNQLFGYSIKTNDGKSIKKYSYGDSLTFENFKSQQELQFLKENVKNIFDCLYFKIDKLPKYMREDIKQEELQRKQEQLKEHRKIENKRFLEEQEVYQELTANEEKKRRKQGRKIKVKTFVNQLNVLKKR